MARPAFPRFTLETLRGGKPARCCVCGDLAGVRAAFDPAARREPEALCSVHARQLGLTADSPHRVETLPVAA